MNQDSSESIPISKSLLLIFLSNIFVGCLALMGWLYYLHLRELSYQDPKYQIIAVVQSTTQAEELKTVYLAELLDLSLDRPTNLYQFDRQEAEQKLLRSPLIKQAQVKKILPGTVFVQYTMRQPMAYLGDYTNTALDHEGFIFPFSPFFTPKKLPTIYLGIDQLDKKWGQSLVEDGRLQLAFDLLTWAQQPGKEGLSLKTIDVSQAFADSYGQRQIILTLEDRIEKDSKDTPISYTKSYLLRLNSEEYYQDLARFLTLRQHLNQNDTKHSVQALKPVLIDLRIPYLAFIQAD